MTTGKKIRTAVIGVGYLGKFHADKYASLDNAELVAIADTNQNQASMIAEQYAIPAYANYQQILDKVDAVSIATPTSSHYAIAKHCLQQGIHVLVEKPITVSINEADELIALAQQHHCILQVGHLERFNAAVLGVSTLLQQPTFIETHRLAPFKTRATDVNVILDLMIHDIDIILNLVKANVVNIAASGTRVLSDSTDIANVRLTFGNGCVANVTASRVSLKTERKMRIFQEDKYISVDFQNRILSQHYRGKGESTPGIPRIESEETVYDDHDALKAEIASFINCIEYGNTPLVSGEDGRRALNTATIITDLINNPAGATI